MAERLKKQVHGARRENFCVEPVRGYCPRIAERSPNNRPIDERSATNRSRSIGVQLVFEMNRQVHNRVALNGGDR